MNTPSQHRFDDSIADRLAKLEERISRIEEHLRSAPYIRAQNEEKEEPTAEVLAVTSKDEDELEFELGQNWFAKVGIVVIALGIVFLLTFPYGELPVAVPALFGYFLAGGVFLLAHFWQNTFDLVSRYLRGAAMVLLFFTSLRLFFFGREAALSTQSAMGITILVLVLVVNLAIALRRKSPYLFGLALFTGYATAVVVGTTWFMLPCIAFLSLLAVYACVRNDWSGLLTMVIPLAYLGHLVWAINNPFLGNDIRVVALPFLSVCFLLTNAVVFGLGVLLRRNREREGFETVLSSLLNGTACVALIMLHLLAAGDGALEVSHLVIASVVFLGLGIAFWVREQSRYSTFIYAMLGYLAMSVAILKAVLIPNAFVWLSLQSIIVVATAIWFRSRFIVVANFLIFLIIAIGYIVVAQVETGISLIFGVVALASARILNWQQSRLELKTELMRNAYLTSAFVVFPYALYHLVPRDYVSLSWVGIAGFYYLMNIIIKAQKYRWMGHLTLLLTVLYVLIIGIIQLEPTLRIVSFLVLGTVLLGVSLVFTRLRARRKSKQEG